MWLTIVLMALAVSTEPFRLGMTALLLTRPRPVANLLAFLVGGFLMGLAVGAAVLFGLRRAISAGQSTLPLVQIVIGLMALLLAALIAAGVRWPGRRTTTTEDATTSSRLLERTRRLVGGRAPWTTGVAGLAIALPSTDYLAALAVILASGATPSSQIGAVVVYNVVAFALVESSLLAHLFAPEWTLARVSALNDWFTANRRRGMTVTLLVVGVVLLSIGLITL